MNKTLEEIPSQKELWNIIRCSCGKHIKKIKAINGIKKRVVIEAACDYCKKHVRKG